jgi:RimJ/RimL family protein N-acetyltransferase
MAAGAELLPERIEGEDLLLRRWAVADADELWRAVADSAEHLRPWMSWMAEEPLTRDEYEKLLARWEREWLDGGDVAFGIFVEGRVAGSCGLHRRRGPRALEIGYWIHVAFTRRGLARAAARMLTDAALGLPGIEAVEIHHDKANAASAGIPRGLGFRFVGETPDGASAPAEIGIDCAWRMNRESWEALTASSRVR